MIIYIEYVEKLAKVLTDNSLTEISLEDGEQAITLRKDIIGVGASAVATPVVQPSIQVPAQSVEQVVKNTGKPITSPMVGTFYSAPSPDSKPFVQVGQTIKEGDIVCIVEAMKLMNEIESEVSGKITEICVSDGQPVEFGQVLMYVE